MSEAPQLTIEDIERMNLLGLMLGGVIARNLAQPAGAAAARKLHGSLAVTAGKMSITLRFDRGPITLTRGAAERTRARIKGSLDGLLQVSLGRGPIRAFLAGELSFRGSPLFALKTLPLMRAVPPAATGGRR